MRGDSLVKRIYAVFDRDKECIHPSGFPYRGRIPNTGPQVCPLCGTRKEDASA